MIYYGKCQTDNLRILVGIYIYIYIYIYIVSAAFEKNTFLDKRITCKQGKLNTFASTNWWLTKTIIFPSKG